MRISLAAADRFAAELGLSLGKTPVCLACLSFVSASLRQQDTKDARRWAKEMAPMIWGESLDEPVLRAVRRAVVQGVPSAKACLADIENRGGRSVVARAIVFRLAGELAEEERRSAELRRQQPELLGPAPPEWN